MVGKSVDGLNFFFLDSFLRTDEAKSRVLRGKTTRDDKNTWSPVAVPLEQNITDWEDLSLDFRTDATSLQI